jgi:hypothetical protein
MEYCTVQIVYALKLQHTTGRVLGAEYYSTILQCDCTIAHISGNEKRIEWKELNIDPCYCYDVHRCRDCQSTSVVCEVV